MFKRITIITTVLISCLALPAQANLSFEQNLSGKILLQAQSHGEAWYINPSDQKKYLLGKPDDAFNIMKLFSIGITNKNLMKIPIGLTETNALDNDDDNDGLPNDLEKALGTDPAKTDSDNDGYDDKTEITNNYNPAGRGKMPIDLNFLKKNSGKIFLQVESRGECWYVNPTDNRRYFLSKPREALTIMSKLGQGISDNDLEKITTGHFHNQLARPINDASANYQADANVESIVLQAGNSIRKNDADKVASYFIPAMGPIIKYTMNFLTAEGRLIWSQMLSGSSLLSSNNTERLYHNYVYFQGEKIEIKYHVRKQDGGQWLIANL
jgi:hypothetical protein